MDDRKNNYFKQLLLICSITIVLELVLNIWSSIQVSKLDLNISNIESIQLAKKGVMTSLTLQFGTLITTCFSIIIPEIKVWDLFNKTYNHKYYWIAIIFFVAYLFIPVINTSASIYGEFMFLKEAENSMLQMISLL